MEAFLLGALAYLVRTNSELVDLDASVAQWGADHASPLSDRALGAVTQLGATWLVVIVAFVVAVLGYVRRPNRWIPVFLLAVIVGERVLVNGIKDLVDRIRPTLSPIVETLGPSFPSGHTTTAAAFYAAAALVLGRGVGKHCRALLAGAAVGIAVAVACTRVLLDVHWLSDVTRDSFSAGHGSRLALSRSADVACFASELQSMRQCTKPRWSKSESWRPRQSHSPEPSLTVCEGPRG